VLLRLHLSKLLLQLGTMDLSGRKKSGDERKKDKDTFTDLP
jgi:hypothetical protein